METTKPLLKWPGGKRRVLPELEKVFPKEFEHYYEPFIGGGAVFFDIQPLNATVSDINPELVNLYTVVKNSPEELIAELMGSEYQNTQEVFYTIRSRDREEKFSVSPPVKRAARTIYLNRTCFNGLYRLNQKGFFNTSYGFYESPRILDEENIRAISKFLRAGDKTITSGSFETILSEVANGGNLIYMDPPYIPLTASANFVNYSKEGFSFSKQEKLRDEALRLDEMGNFVILSNSDTPKTRELYSDFVCVPINVLRSISVKASTRVKTGELIILGHELAKQYPELKKLTS